MVNKNRRKASVSQPDEPSVDWFPILLGVFIDPGEQTGDIVENQDAKVPSGIEHCRDFVPHGLGGENKILFTLLIDKLTREKFQGRNWWMFEQSRGPVPQFIGLHFAVNVEDPDRSRDRPLQEGLSRSERCCQGQLKEGFPHPTRAMDHRVSAFGKPCDMAGALREIQRK
jgi:hypothetical protein